MRERNAGMAARRSYGFPCQRIRVIAGLGLGLADRPAQPHCRVRTKPRRDPPLLLPKHQVRSRPPVSSSMETAISEMITHTIMYHAGAIVSPVTLISQATTSCAEPPNTDTATA
ncbi:hypothetical protein ABH944_006823 [Caballeronia udeis]|uniref:Uncharacterized protein n=1 Tax=Caballeronia udeis TaxID=1232866 RepID=A0ABW8MSD7_9BURK